MELAMLIIRRDQMEIFREHMLKQFENLQLAHLNKYYAEECQALGEEGVREAIRYGIEQANRHDVLIEYDVSRYINLMFNFGRDFDTDPAFPWAAEILKDEGTLSGSAKMDRLYDEAEKHLSQALGIDRQQKEKQN
jgi:hypothetical protein